MKNQAKSAGRTQKGTFAQGNPGGPGRPSRATELSYLKVLVEACPPEKFREIVESTIEAAKSGDAKAREWLSSYLCGVPGGKSAILSKLDEIEARSILAGRRVAVDVAAEQQSLEMMEQIFCTGSAV